MVQSFYFYLLLYQESNVNDTSKDILRSSSWMLITNVGYIGSSFVN